MSHLYFRTLSKAVNHYLERGYTFPFNFSKETISPARWAIVEVYRFEGFTDPSDNAILYVLEHENGRDKGTIVDSYGAKTDKRISQFLESIPRLFPA